MILDRLIAVIQKAGCEPTGEQIAEALWMLQYLPVSAAVSGAAKDSVISPSEAASPLAATQSEPVPAAPLPTAAPSVPPAPAADLLAVTSGAEGGRAAGGALIRVSGAPALPNAPGLARALRPLARRVAQPGRTVLEVDDTVRQLVEQRIFRPVLRPERGRWLALHLVIDANPSMGMWRTLADELRLLLLRRGVFRNIRVWALDPSRAEVEPALAPLSRAGRVSGTARRPAALVDPTGRTLVLVVSDCVAVGWRSGRVGRALETWGRTGPAAVVQVLPERLWSRTSLGGELEASLRARAPSVPNAQLVTHVEDAWMFADGLPRGAYAPLLALDPRDFSGWTRMLAGAPGPAQPGYLFAREPAADLVEDGPPASAAVWLERFLCSTSPLGIRLARLLAAAPVISLPIIRIVQDELLRDARPSHTAEVLLGGLLRPLLHADDPEAVVYDFVDGARETLLRQSNEADIRAVFLAVSDYIAANAGAGRRFPAAADVDGAADLDESQTLRRSFARATAAVLRELGHPELASRLEGAPVEQRSAPEETAVAPEIGGSTVLDSPGVVSEDRDNTVPAEVHPSEGVVQAVSEWLKALAQHVGAERTREAQAIEEQELAEDLSIAALHIQAARRAVDGGNIERLVRKLRLIERDLGDVGVPVETRRLIDTCQEQISLIVENVLDILPNTGNGSLRRDDVSGTASEVVSVGVIASILWVDDKPDNIFYARRILENAGFQSSISTSTDQAIAMLLDSDYDVVISDMSRPPDTMAGYTLLEEMRSRGIETPFILFSSTNSDEHKRDAVNRGAVGTTNSTAELVAMVRSAIDQDK